MKAYKLEVVEATGRKIILTRKEASTLTSFQRSDYANPLKEILEKVVDDARVQYETEPASEANRMRVMAAKDLLAVLFTGKVETE